MNIIAICELAQRRLLTASLEQLALARALAGDGHVIALFLCGDKQTAQTLISRGADIVALGTQQLTDSYDSDTCTSIAAQVAKDHQVSLILAAHTPTGADLMPRLAFRLNGGCATGCVAIEQSNGSLHFTRASHGGNVRETLSFKTSVVTATVRAGAYDAQPADTSRTGEIIELNVKPTTRIRVIERRNESTTGPRLEDAKVIVSGGRGLGGPEGFKVLAPLAQTLNGVVGASRVPCDLGWCSHAMQIGLTGKTVTPELYIAVGISGASHHLAGCGNAKTIEIGRAHV